MSHRHLQILAIAATAILAATGFAGSAQSADPTWRIRDASPTQVRDLDGKVRNAPVTRNAVPAPAGQETKDLPNQATPPVQPTERELKAGAAIRASLSERGLNTPIGTLNIVRGEQAIDDTASIAERPAGQDQGISR